MSRKFVREDYLCVDIKMSPVLPAREIAIAWLDELGFEVFEPTDTGLKVYAPFKSISSTELKEIRLKLEGLSELIWTESIVVTENWNALWEADYNTVDIDGRALVRAPFHAPPAEGLDVIIKPNMSFGTGHHATTWLMMRVLLDSKVERAKVLDMGCGTGVLAIAALKLGASAVLAIDIEQGACENTLENLQLNSINKSSKLEVLCGGAEQLALSKVQSFDLILANINRNVLIDNISLYSDVLKVGGNIVLSGFFIQDVPLLSSAVNDQNLIVIEVVDKDGWACMNCGKPSL